MTLHSNPCLFALPLCLGFLALAGATLLAGEKETRWWRIAFQAPDGFGAPAKAGQDAVSLACPPGAEPGKERIEIVLAAFPKGMQEASGLAGDALAGYFRTTFLGASPETRKRVERTFLGRIVAGDWRMSSIPRKASLESYIITLPDGDAFGLAVRAAADVPAEETEKLLSALAASLRLEPAGRP